jgi:hypothetical protein
MADAPSSPSPADNGRLDPDPVIEVYRRDVDRTLIREQLRRSIDERVRRMISALRFATALREAGRRRETP